MVYGRYMLVVSLGAAASASGVSMSVHMLVDANASNQAMQLTASKPAVYASSVCRRERMLRGMHRGLAAADLVSR